MVQKIFGIYSEVISGEETFIETGDEYAACWVKDGNRFTAFEIFSKERLMEFDDMISQMQLYSRVLYVPTSSVKYIFSGNECVISKNDDASFDYSNYFKEVYPSAQDVSIITAASDGLQFIFSVPKQLSGANNGGLTHKFQLLANSHQQQNIVSLNFYPGNINLFIRHSADRFFVNNFTYKNTEDVLYHVLNAMENFGLEASTTAVEIMGLIDVESKIYKELHGYFAGIQLIGLTNGLELTEAFAEYPTHYFSPFFNFHS